METRIHRVEKVVAGEIQHIVETQSGTPFSYRIITGRTAGGEEFELTLVAAESDSLIIEGGGE